MLDRLDVNDSGKLGGGTNISLEVEMKTLVQKNGNDIVVVDRLDESIDGEVTDISIAIYWTRREFRPLQRLLESREYLVREKGRKHMLRIFVVIVGDVKVSQSFRETMQEPDIQWASIVKEINIIKTKKIYELVE